MERIAVDIAGPFPLSNKGNKYILVIQDYFTKWVECFPMTNMEAGTVAKIMVEEVVTKFGIPNKIHSDQGRQFESALFKEMCTILQIEKTRTTAYHPQSDGMVERFNRTLASMVSMFVDENHSDWDELLPYMTMAYRATANETTGMSPNILMLGRETTTPLDIAFEMPAAIKAIPATQWVWELQDRLERAHTFVREQTGRSINRQKKYHDRKLVFDNIHAGDCVYVFFPIRTSGCSRKWTSFWRGPFKVSKKLSDVLFEINCGQNGTSELIHIERIMKAGDQTLPGEETREILTDSELQNGEIEESEYEEDRIDTEGRPKRIVRKPAWLTDYVCSLSRSRMADKRKGPNTKITPRKHKEPGFICNLCKVHIGTIQAYKKHIVQCLESRVYCETCGKSFAKHKYLNQHMSRFHGKNANKSENKSDNKTSAMDKMSVDSDSDSERKPESMKSDSEDIDDDDSDCSNLSKDPDIYLEEEQVDKTKDAPVSMVSEDSRNVRDIRVGRMYRKKTNPMPVWAPVKLKNESTSIIISEQDKKCSDDQETDAKVCSVKKTESACKPKSVDFKSSSVKGVKDATPEKLRSEDAHKPEMKDLDQVNIEKKDNNKNGPGKRIQEANIVQEK
ncbi:MAG: DDE-type integrase/transposase/recombinase, partial [Candidatus Thiodiazotropha taylori]|nr:DDE-type integrase/transposase/recombinase [Candidatus Thiodiazotropha taylori]MCW4334820.1 DDE-type integrase/transposase/recombinase [Candidatus Thiodiazotropha endolucinida]